MPNESNDNIFSEKKSLSSNEERSKIGEKMVKITIEWLTQLKLDISVLLPSNGYIKLTLIQAINFLILQQ